MDNVFKQVIEEHLNELAKQDVLFAKTYKKENKSIDECLDYIISEVKGSGRIGFADEEIYGLAVHYYDEDNIEIVKPKESVRVVVNKEIHKVPIRAIIKQPIARPKKKRSVNDNQLHLF